MRPKSKAYNDDDFVEWSDVQQVDVPTPPELVDDRPWRRLVSSEAIQFCWNRRRDSTLQGISDQDKAAVLGALEARYEAQLAYAKFQSAVRDLIVAASKLPAYAAFQTPVYLLEDKDVYELLRRMVSASGPLRLNRPFLLSTLNWIDSIYDRLAKYLNSPIVVRESRSGKISIRVHYGDYRRWNLSTSDARERAEEIKQGCEWITPLLASASRNLYISMPPDIK